MALGSDGGPPAEVGKDVFARSTDGVAEDARPVDEERWPALSGQLFALDKWTLCRLPLCCAGFGVARREGVARPEWRLKPAAKFMLPRPAAGGRSRRDPASGR